MSHPILVSERESVHQWPDGRWDDSHWEDCVFCSGVMFANAVKDGIYPPTHAEAETLRSLVAGPIGGTTTDLLAAAMRSRYGWTGSMLPYGLSFANLWSNLTPGTGAVVLGRLSGLALGNRLRRWQPSYAGGHAIYVQRDDSTDRVWWMDPLALTGYAGEYATSAELAAYYLAFRVAGAGTLIAPTFVAPIPGEDDLNLATDIPVALCDVAPGTDVIDAATGKVVIPGWAGGQGIGLYSIGGGNAALRLDHGDSQVGHSYFVGYVDPAKVSGVRLKDAPPPAGDTTAAYNEGVDAAVEAAGKARK